MTCTRDTYIAEWHSWKDAIEAWEACKCVVCDSALEEVPDGKRIDVKQTTL